MIGLRKLLETTISEAADNGAILSLKNLTVLAVGNDPFRVDTPAGHRDGAWLADTADALGLGDRQLHLRGLHYAILGRPKPNGAAYTNTDADWQWLLGHAAKAARWLGYIGFDRILDQRNAEPTVNVFLAPEPTAYIEVGLDVQIPEAEELHPQVWVDGFVGVQPYKLVLVGEKSSLGDVLGQVAATHAADLYLPAGEISDTMCWRMANTGATDGRPMVVLYFADCDPSGHQMGISVARKLQALKTGLFPDLDFEVRRVALTPAQVREYGLPSTPLKETERRADRWKAATGVAQTEIDALAALRPDLLREIATDAIAPFFDHTLRYRVEEARRRWRQEAQQIVDEATSESLYVVQQQAATQLAQMRVQIDQLNHDLRIDTSQFELPPIEVPDPELQQDPAVPPLLDSRWPFRRGCEALIASKAYLDGGTE